MNLTQKPNLKPFRDYNKSDVINFYAHVSGTVNAGTFVIATVADPDANPAAIVGDLGGTPAFAKSPRWEVPFKVRSTTSGEVPLGITLEDVREFKNNGERLVYDTTYSRSNEQSVISGRAVPILTRGLVEINGFSGVPGPMSGAIAHPTVEGQLLVSNASTGQIGKFLTSSGADGYALFKINL